MKVLIAFNMPWHPEHLGCAVCGTPFTGGKRVMEGKKKKKKKKKNATCFFEKTYLGEDGNAYCERDFIDTFAVKCGKCSEVRRRRDRNPFVTFFFKKKCLSHQPIIGECVNALGVGYHPEHFCCEVCKTTLEGAFFEHEGGIYCEQHYYKVSSLFVFCFPLWFLGWFLMIECF